jgi:hypothetical protein
MEFVRFRLAFVEPPWGDVERIRVDLALTRNNTPVVHLVGADQQPVSAILRPSRLCLYL